MSTPTSSETPLGPRTPGGAFEFKYCVACVKIIDLSKAFATYTGRGDGNRVKVGACSESCYEESKRASCMKIIKESVRCLVCGGSFYHKHNFLLDPSRPTHIMVTCSPECRKECEYLSTCFVCARRMERYHTMIVGKTSDHPVYKGEIYICSRDCEEKMNIGNINEKLSCTICSNPSNKKFNVSYLGPDGRRFIATTCSLRCANSARKIPNANPEELSVGMNCAKCLNKQQGKDKYKTCSICRQVNYCSKECQVAHWPTHKAGCKKGEDKRNREGGSEGDKKSDKTEKVEEVD